MLGIKAAISQQARVRVLNETEDTMTNYNKGEL
jgi:hypothetical protein